MELLFLCAVKQRVSANPTKAIGQPSNEALIPIDGMQKNQSLGCYDFADTLKEAT